MKIDMSYFLKSLLIAFLAFISPIKWLIIGVFVLVIGDTIFAIYRAYINKEDITSRKLSHIISKLFLYCGAILLSYICELVFGLGTLFPLARIVASAISITELKSIMETVQVLTGLNIFLYITNFLKRSSDNLSKSISDVEEQTDKKTNDKNENTK
jgi:hypothetical protein